jgi:ankyrin repeat protein
MENLNKDLFEAVENNDLAKVTLLLNNGADVDTFTDHGYNVLMLASYEGYLEIVQELLKKKADVNLLGFHKCTALSQASKGGHINIVELLLQNGADINATDSYYGETTLEWALRTGNEELIKIFFKYGADTDSFEEDQERYADIIEAAKDEYEKSIIENKMIKRSKH